MARKGGSTRAAHVTWVSRRDNAWGHERVKDSGFKMDALTGGVKWRWEQRIAIARYRGRALTIDSFKFGSGNRKGKDLLHT